MRDPIPVMMPKLPTLASVSPYLSRMQSTRVYTNNGPLVHELESRYAALLKISESQVVAAANATLALTGCLQISLPDRWLLPDWTFAATGHAACQSGKFFEFRDVSEETWMLTPLQTDARGGFGLLPVMPFGAPVDLAPSEKFKVGVVDAAASLGNMDALSDLAPDWAVVYSLHATKILGCGEGSIVAFGSQSGAAKFRAWINFGFAGQRVSKFPATNAKMSELHAAYALGALDEWSQERSEWEKANAIARRVMDASNVSGLPSQISGLSPYWIARFSTPKHAAIVESHFEQAHIGTRRWWPRPLSQMPAFVNRPCVATPVSHRLAEQVLGLPMYREMDSAVEQSVGRLLHLISESQGA